MKQRELTPLLNKLAFAAFELVFSIKIKRFSKKVTLQQLVKRISSKAKPIETTELIKAMRERNYGY